MQWDGDLKDGYYGRPYWYTVSMTNPYPDLFNRFHQVVFPAVKARIEALRPGRTWVEIIDWNDDYTDPPNDYWDESGQDTTIQYVPMVVSRMDSFYGTNFFHINIGSIFQAGGNTWDGDTSSDAYKENKEQLTQVTPLYAGFGVALYGLDQGIDFPDFGTAPYFPCNVGAMPPGPMVLHTDGPTWVLDPVHFTHASVPPPTNYTLPLTGSITSNAVWKSQDFDGDGFAAAQARLKKTVDDWNQANSDWVDARNQEKEDLNNDAQALAADLAEFGFTFEGDGAQIGEDELVALIARHFKFDPQTGKDLA
jgi:hypothetical protein